VGDKTRQVRKQKPNLDELMKVTITYPDGYRTQRALPSDPFSYADILYNFGEVAEIPRFQVEKLIKKGTAKLVESEIQAKEEHFKMKATLEIF